MRVLHCPTNIAGQMWEYTQALRAFGVETTALTFARNAFGYQDDLCLNLTAESNIWRRRWRLVRNFENIVRQYDVIHFHFGRTLLPHYLDLPVLRLLGKKVVMNWWGSEVRLPSIAALRNPYLSEMWGSTPKNESAIRNRLTRVSRYVPVAVVADAELKGYVNAYFDRVEIMPQAVPVEDMKPQFPVKEEDNPLIVHCPSNRSKKGTPHVLKAIERLQKEHRFRFQLLEGMPHSELLSCLSQADIIVDQLLLGTHGILAIEAMALGKPVLCYIRDDLHKEYPADLPIVNATIETLEFQLEKLLEDPESRVELGKRGRRYAERRHSLHVVGRKLVELYESL